MDFAVVAAAAEAIRLAVGLCIDRGGTELAIEWVFGEDIADAHLVAFELDRHFRPDVSGLTARRRAAVSETLLRTDLADEKRLAGAVGDVLDAAAGQAVAGAVDAAGAGTA